jgi:hypothetical protein
MAWNPAIPATNADLLSAPVRDNFGALDTALMAALAALANGQVLTKAAGPVLAGVPAGTNGQVLTLTAGSPGWAAAPGFTNPMSAVGDLIIGSTAGAPARLAIGTAGFVLTSVAGSPAWQSGLSNPMTSIGDLIRGGTSGAPTRMAAVATGAVLASAGVTTAPTWNTAPSLTSLTLSGLMQGSVLFAGSGGLVSQDNASLFFDDTSNSLRLGASAVGTSGQRVLALGPGTAPTTSPVDTIQMWTEDYDATAGSRGLVIRDEAGAKYELGSWAPGTFANLRITTSDSKQMNFVTGATGSEIRGGPGLDLTMEANNAAAPGAWFVLKADGSMQIKGLGVSTARTVSTGAIDSGGSGYRMLIVANA